MAYSKVVQRYVEEYRDSGIKRDFAEAVQNCFEMECSDFRVIPSIEEERAFVRYVAGCRGEVDSKAADAENNWDFERMVPADEIANSGVCGKTKEI